MKICFIPIDNRPVCYDLARDICAIDDDIELYIPPIEYLGSLTKYAQVDKIYEWLERLPEVDAMVIALDTIAYGGLIPSRRINDSYEEIKTRLTRLKPILKGKKVYAFSSIMRISNNNYNEEEKEYWKDWGKKIFEYSFNSCKLQKTQETDVPVDILEDYLVTRKRNFAINALYIEWQDEGLFDTLIFSKDDCAEYGFNVSEAIYLEQLGGITKTGADEIPLTLLARALNKDIKIFPEFIEPEYKNCISNYEDVSIEQSVLGQLSLGGFVVASSKEEADIILLINNFIEKQGELVMGWETGGKYIKGKCKNITDIDKPLAIADVRFANGADNDFVDDLFNYRIPDYGYSAWNTSANTLGSLLAAIKVKFNANKYNDKAFKKLQLIRYLDDWAYQANIRANISMPVNIKEMMTPYENIIINKIYKNIDRPNYNIEYSFPWDRKFEIRISVTERENIN